jgi:hypothetical protein
VAIFVKDPAALVDYAIDWTGGYLGDQVINGSVWRVTPQEADGIAVHSSAILPGKTIATLSGGLIGHLYHVTNTVNFSDSRSDERTLVVRVEER